MDHIKHNFNLKYLKLTKVCIFFLALLFGSCIFQRPLADKLFYEETGTLGEAQISYLFKDLETGEIIEEYQSEKFFTPASNMKLFTLHSVLKVYPDSLPAGCFYDNNDSLVYIPTGDPTFLNEKLSSVPVMSRLKNNSLSEVFVSIPPFDSKVYGPGWAWDDDGKLYQCGRFPLAIYGGKITIDKKVDRDVNAPGEFFDERFIFEPNSDIGSLEEIKLEKKPFSNEISLSRKINKNDDFELEFSFFPTAELLLDLLADTLDKSVTRSYYLAENQSLECYQQASGEVIKKMMHESDNFIAEQLMLMIGYASGKIYSVDKGIDFSSENFFRDFDLSETTWVDGSGLSRYNKTNTRTLVNLLELLIDENDLDQIRSFLPQGGKEGTLSDYYWDQEPYVWAKTGSMKGVYCLSGLLRSAEEKDIVFSVMVNNYKGSTNQVIGKIEKLLKHLRDEH